jgi:hypothetical protein
MDKCLNIDKDWEFIRTLNTQSDHHFEVCIGDIPFEEYKILLTAVRKVILPTFKFNVTESLMKIYFVDFVNQPVGEILANIVARGKVNGTIRLFSDDGGTSRSISIRDGREPELELGTLDMESRDKRVFCLSFKVRVTMSDFV